MVRGLDTIWKVASERKVSLRTAAFIVAIGRVGKARVLRGIGN
jgi:glutamate dehydrogenase (NAD(P)+)